MNGNYYTLPLPDITGELKQAARDALPVIDKRLIPATREFISGAAVTSVLCYFKDDLPETMHAALSDKWFRCLKEYPDYVVSDAFDEYDKNNNKRKKPTPGEINKICSRLVSKVRALKRQCDKIMEAPLYESEPEQTEDEREASRGRVDKILKEAGIKRVEGEDDE